MSDAGRAQDPAARYRERLRGALLRGVERAQRETGELVARPEPEQRRGRPEAAIGARLVRYLERHGVTLHRRTTGMFRTIDGRRNVYVGTPGEADYWACIRGRHVEVETKAPAGRLSDAQRKFRERIERDGGLYIVARGVSDVAGLVDA